MSALPESPPASKLKRPQTCLAHLLGRQSTVLVNAVKGTLAHVAVALMGAVEVIGVKPGVEVVLEGFE